MKTRYRFTLWLALVALTAFTIVRQVEAAKGKITVSSVTSLGGGLYTITLTGAASIVTNDHVGMVLSTGAGALYKVTAVNSTVSYTISDILDEENGGDFGTPIAGTAWFGTPTSQGFSLIPYQGPGWDAAHRRNYYLANTAYLAGGTDVPVTDGGTGASTAADARTNLGLGTMATQNASAVTITGGSVTGITDVAVADGGTGASTASAARTNLGIPVNPQTAGGRLSVSTDPLGTTGEQSTLRYVEYVGNQVALCNGSGTTWDLYDIGGSVAATTSQLSAGINYDVFLFQSGGTLGLKLEPWASDTARVASADIVRLDGVYTKTTHPAERYLGTIATTGSYLFRDEPHARFVWNWQNRVSYSDSSVAAGGIGGYTITESANFVAMESGDAAWLHEFVRGVASSGGNAVSVGATVDFLGTDTESYSLTVGYDVSSGATMDDKFGFMLTGTQDNGGVVIDHAVTFRGVFNNELGYHYLQAGELYTDSTGGSQTTDNFAGFMVVEGER